MKIFNKTLGIIIGHLIFLGFTIYEKKNNHTEMLFTSIPILSSLFFFLRSNVYDFSKLLHNIREFFIPVRFNWKINVKMEFDNENAITPDVLRNFLGKKLKEFEIKYPSISDSFTITNSGRNTVVNTFFNTYYVNFEISYDSWNTRMFKENLDEHIGKLFGFIKEEFKPIKEIYSINGKCDKFFTNGDIWKLLSEKNSAQIQFQYNHEMQSEKAFVNIIRNNPDGVKEEIQIPSTFSLKKLSSILEDYINLSLTK